MEAMRKREDEAKMRRSKMKENVGIPKAKATSVGSKHSEATSVGRENARFVLVFTAHAKHKHKMKYVSVKVSKKI